MTKKNMDNNNMDLKILINSTIDTCYEYNEEVNIDVLNTLLGINSQTRQSILYDKDEMYSQSGEKWNKSNYIREVTKLLLELKKNNGMRKIQYIYPKNLKNKGRLYVKGSGIQNLQNKLRGALLNGICYDFDMVNAGCSIIKFITKCIDIQTPYLDMYLNHRETFFKEGISKNDINTILFSNKIKKTSNDKLKNLSKEMVYIQKQVYELLRDEIFTDSMDNKEGSILAKVVYIIENIILQECINSLSKESVVQTLMFDGATIKNKSNKNDKIWITETLELFNSISEEYGVKWINKPHNLEIIEDDYFKNLLKGDEIDNDSYVIIDNHQDAGDYVYNLCKDKVHYVANNIIYIQSENFIYRKIKNKDLSIVFQMYNIDIKKYNPKGDIVDFSKNGSDKKNITTAFEDKLKCNQNKNFIDDLIICNRQRLPFQDGVIDFKNNKPVFYKWDEIDFPYYTLWTIPHKYEDVMKIDAKYIKDVDTKIFYNIFGTEEIVSQFKMRMIRAIAGNITDKIFYNMIGSRNCGKGVITEMLTNSFGKECIGYFEVGNLSKNTFSSSDTAKENGWVFDKVHCRLLIANENTTEDTTINGEMIKRLTSGGDKISTRPMKTDPIDTFFNFHILINTNSILQVKPNDALEKMEIYDCPYEYTTQDVIDKNNGQFYKLQDDNIKSVFCANINNQLAFIKILLDSYIDEFKPIKFKSIMEELYDNSLSKVDVIVNSDIFDITHNADDMMTIKDIKSKWNDYIKINKDQAKGIMITKELRKMGLQDKTKNSVRYILGIKYKSPEYDYDSDL